MEENKLLAGSTPDVLSPLRGSRLHKTHHCVRNEDGLWRHYSPTRAHEWGHTCTLSLGVYQPHVITRCRNTLHTCSCTYTCIQPPTCGSGGLGGGTEKKKIIERNQRKKNPLMNRISNVACISALSATIYSWIRHRLGTEAQWFFLA